MSAHRYRYRVYGAILDSALEFPELPFAEAEAEAARWTFDPVSTLPPVEGARLLGEDPLYADVAARLFACRDGLRIVVDDTGTFAISPDGRAIRWCAGGNAWPDFARAHLLGRVLATTFHLEGLLPLHGSAIATADGVLGFLAPKGVGKSTLAYACSAAGARLVTDDTLPVVPGPPTIAWPGVHSLRVHEDAYLAVGAVGTARPTREGKQILATWDAVRVQATPAPLAALYVLAPVEPATEAPTREALSPMLAAILVVAHAKVGRMLGAEAGAELLARGSAIAAAVPVWRLSIPRDLTRLSRTVDVLAQWHGGFA